MDPKELVDYAASLDCIHCGLCLRTCPTYQLTGEEASSPRGRIYLMRGVAEGAIDPAEPTFAEELDFCLVCRHCESVCPAGVRFGEMMETARDRLLVERRTPLERALRWLGFRVVLPSRHWLGAATAGLRLLQLTGLARLSRWTRAVPRVPPRSERAALPNRTPATGPKRASAAVLEGCVMRELYGRVNRATVATLARLGVESHSAPEHVCCGALHAHNGDLAGARALARRTVLAFEALRDERGAPLPLVVNSAGCGAHLRDYGRLLADDPEFAERARALAARAVDFSVFAARHAPAEFAPSGAGLGRITYDDPCHLCHGQGVRREPRALLDRLSGCERVELPESESCCGSAGIYALLRPNDSQAIFARKLEALETTGAQVLVTANPGCQMQWETGLARAGSRVRVMHLAELLAGADSGHGGR